MGLLTQDLAEGCTNRERKGLPKAEEIIRALEPNVTGHNGIEGFGTFAGRYNPLQTILVRQHTSRKIWKIQMISSFLEE